MRKVITILLVTLIFITTVSIKSEGTEQEENPYVLGKTAAYNPTKNAVDYELTVKKNEMIKTLEDDINLTLVMDTSASTRDAMSFGYYERIESRYYEDELYENASISSYPSYRVNKPLTFGELGYYHSSNKLFVLDEAYPGNFIEVSIKWNGHNYTFKYQGKEYAVNDEDLVPFKVYKWNDYIPKIKLMNTMIDQMILKLKNISKTHNININIAFVTYADQLFTDGYLKSVGSGIFTHEGNRLKFKRYVDIPLDDEMDFYYSIDDKNIDDVTRNIIVRGDRTSPHLGLDLARKTLTNNKNSYRNIILFMGDGKPEASPYHDIRHDHYPSEGTYYLDDFDKSDDIKNVLEYDPESQVLESLKQSYLIKKNSNAEIYSYQIKGLYDQEQNILNRNFLEIISSDFSIDELPKNLNDSSILSKTENKYFNKIDSEKQVKEAIENVVNAFEISNKDVEQVYSIEDHFPSYLDLSKLTKDDVEVYMLKDDNRQLLTDLDIEVNPESKKIIVTNLEEYKDSLSDNHTIQLKYQVPLVKGFIGGNNVATNLEKTAIYNKHDEEISKFPQPVIDVPLKFELFPSDKAIFLSNALNLNNLFNAKEQFTYNIGDAKFHIDGINNMYVDIVLSIHKGSETIGEVFIPSGKKLDHLALSDLNGLSKDEKLSVTYTVSPTYQKGDGVLPIDVEKSVNLFVYKPIIEAKDSSSLLGEPMDIKYNLPEESEILWTNENTKLKPDGEKPDVKLKVDNLGSLYLQESRLFQFNVLLNGTDYSEHLFEQGKNVFNHFITGSQIKVRKNVDKKFKKDDTFVFKLQWERPEYLKHFDNYDVSFTLKGNDEVIINNLPVGKYQLCEDINWSWRYSTKESCYEIELKNEDRIIEFNNLLENKRTNGVEVVVENIFNE